MNNKKNCTFPKLIHLSKLHFVGYCVGIYSNILIVRVPHYINLDRFMVNNISYNNKSLGTFILIESMDHFFIGVIIKEDLSEHDTKELISDKYHKKTETPELYVKILAGINPIDRSLEKFEEYTPVINSRVYLANNGLIKDFITEMSEDFNNSKAYDKAPTEVMTHNFAKLSKGSQIPINFSFDTLFNKHLGIIGSTGSGKSYTAAKLILSLINKNQHIIILDPTGEYKNIIQQIKNNKNQYGENKKVSISAFNIGDKSKNNNIKIPYYDLNDNELYKLVRPSSGIQFPKLRDSINDLKFVHLMIIHKDKWKKDIKYLNDSQNIIKFNGNNEEVISKLRSDIASGLNDCHGHCEYNFYKLPEQLKEECYKYNRKDKAYPDTRLWGYIASLADRINSFIHNILFSQYFCSLVNLSSENEKFQNSLTYDHITKRNILYIDLENVTLANHISEIVGDYIARKLLLTFTYNSKKIKNKEPVVMFLDEAHNFIKKDNDNDDYHLHAFNLIAKEGRKYGLFMTLITQSPYDLSRDVLTQFGTFIIHHLGNGKEREQITSALPYNSNLDKYISSLNTGEAIISSNNLYIPLMLYINTPNIPPKSNTPKFR